MPPPTNTSSDCDYIRHDNGVHEFVFKKSSRMAMDFMLKYAREVRDTLDEDDFAYFLNDFRPAGFPPFGYALKETQKLNRRYRVNHHIVQAILIKSGPMIELAKTFVNNAFPNGSVKFFRKDQRAEALAWLESRIESEK